ncbi:hypothetical protein AK812_SmicGene2390 [Symbiodinium microadriaticum]|uniref:Uncharacterized protein n=1 Tax=Symbiodinium microadriaticum TaxID=2951 RepID=A0A1Q9F1N5_SYMMI|nr:hypothetical protein AK812_SmicGene2390 [Symbiodinium microadriaticum]
MPKVALSPSHLQSTKKSSRATVHSSLGEDDDDEEEVDDDVVSLDADDDDDGDDDVDDDDADDDDDDEEEEEEDDDDGDVALRLGLGLKPSARGTSGFPKIADVFFILGKGSHDLESVSCPLFWAPVAFVALVGKECPKLKRRSIKNLARRGDEQQLLAEARIKAGGEVCSVTIVHDTIMIPLLTAFPLRSEGVVESLELTSCIVWIIDIVATFLRGFINPRTGFVEMRLKQITLNYLTGWFVPDLAMLSSDIMSLLLEMRETDSRMFCDPAQGLGPPGYQPQFQ